MFVLNLIEISRTYTRLSLFRVLKEDFLKIKTCIAAFKGGINQSLFSLCSYSQTCLHMITDQEDDIDIISLEGFRYIRGSERKVCHPRNVKLRGLFW